MVNSSRLVQEHLAALIRGGDWTSVEAATSRDVQLRLAGNDYQEWSLYTLYRFMSQAWNFGPDQIQLTEISPGNVHVCIQLGNGGDWVEHVSVDYEVRENEIVSITLTDGPTIKAR